MMLLNSSSLRSDIDSVALVAAAAHVQFRAEAGATWWIESIWDDDGVPFEDLQRRIEQGPPRV